MKKRKVKKTTQVAPVEALRFLEDIRTLSGNIDEPTVLISIRIPGNILRAVKLAARHESKKYQSLIVEYIRNGLKKERRT